MRTAALLTLHILLASPALAADATSPAEELVPGVELVRGAFVSGRQPDGNSVLLMGPEGIVVVDTGRHEAHTRKILDAARAAGAPIVAVLNTHWHLDHISGNILLRREVPGVRVLASGAIFEARKGFLATYREQLEGALAKEAPTEQKAAWRDEVVRIDAGDAFVPDEVIAKPGRRRLGGRELEIEVAAHAVTAADVWLFDPATRTLVAGDLVTLPVPFLDTACVGGWRSALDRLAARDFAQLVPGHGPPLDRAQFESYRSGFGHLVDCAASEAAGAVCAEGWQRDLAPLLAQDDPAFVRSLLDYYIEQHLRAGRERDRRFCGDAAAAGAPGPDQATPGMP